MVLSPSQATFLFQMRVIQSHENPEAVVSNESRMFLKGSRSLGDVWRELVTEIPVDLQNEFLENFEESLDCGVPTKTSFMLEYAISYTKYKGDEHDEWVGILLLLREDFKEYFRESEDPIVKDHNQWLETLEKIGIPIPEGISD